MKINMADSSGWIAAFLFVAIFIGMDQFIRVSEHPWWICVVTVIVVVVSTALLLTKRIDKNSSG